MGTDSDHKIGTPKIPLIASSGESPDLLGFYLTREGRSFLQKLFKHFLARANLGERKVASIVSDHAGNPNADSKEVELVRSALRRWNRDGQIELFPKDAQKNARVMQRLEREMLEQPDIRVVLSDVAKTDEKVQIGEALARIYYTQNNLKNRHEIAYLQAAIDGLYQEWASDEMPIGVGTEQYRYIKTGGRIFYRLRQLSEMNFMVAQKFSSVREGAWGFKGTELVTMLHTGFGFPLPDGSIHLHFFNLGPPNTRVYEVLTKGFRQHRIPENFDAARQKARMWASLGQSFSASLETLESEKKEVVWDHIEVTKDVDNLLTTLEKQEWILG